MSSAGSNSGDGASSQNPPLTSSPMPKTPPASSLGVKRKQPDSAEDKVFGKKRRRWSSGTQSPLANKNKNKRTSMRDRSSLGFGVSDEMEADVVASTTVARGM